LLKSGVVTDVSRDAWHCEEHGLVVVIKYGVVFPAAALLVGNEVVELQWNKYNKY
jgi:hypothetical protein